MRWYSLYSLARSCISTLMATPVADRNSPIETNANISTLELKRLLLTLSSYATNVRFRCRPVGEHWMKHFCQISNVRDATVVLFDHREAKYYLFDIGKILQFEVDRRWEGFKPNHHYNVFAIQKELEKVQTQ
jgi:hypothetical protein